MAAKERDILKERIGILTVDISIMNRRLSQKDSLITEYQAKDNANDVIIASMREQRAALEDEKKIFNDQLRGYEGLLRRERRKRFWTTVGGLVTTGIAGYMYFVK